VAVVVVDITMAQAAALEALEQELLYL